VPDETETFPLPAAPAVTAPRDAVRHSVHTAAKNFENMPPCRFVFNIRIPPNIGGEKRRPSALVIIIILFIL